LIIADAKELILKSARKMEQDDPFEDAVASQLGSAVDSSLSSSSTNHVSSLLTCAFNQDGGCLAVGTTQGFSVHNLHPHYAVSVSRQLQGGIGIVEMLFRCNLMAVVGGGAAPHSPPHRVLIWDDHIAREIGELSFKQAVLRVRLRKDTVAVALRDRVYVYHLADLSLRDKIYTADNPDGLLCLSTQIQDMVLACPSVTTGHVRVELYGLRKTVVRTHEMESFAGCAFSYACRAFRPFRSTSVDCCSVSSWRRTSRPCAASPSPPTGPSSPPRPSRGR
jgi:hypothetical protein